MPVLEVYSAIAPKDLKSFIKRLSAVFAEQIGKPESFCLVTFNQVDSLVFNGTDEPGYLCKVISIGHIENDRNAKLTAAITAELEKELGVSDSRGYFAFSDIAAENIGTRKTTFANIVRERQK
ncbi:hypothetical protein CU097_005727 [Rhizopus azygosporus]|uniref:L-dopachrome isomerase n=1 Tax=Rhizopus azygosporus TaxID=86630 RepID=A0A367JK21_RHIAZ|nr:hypothetical protein CU097_005727 [Rhizopus azygosporus]